MRSFIFLLVMLIFCSIDGQAQQFTIGTYLDMEYNNDMRVYPLLDSLHINTLMAHTPLADLVILSNYNLLAFKEDNPQDYIAYYARGYYKKWNANENQTNNLATGVKHNGGTATNFYGVPCWSSGNGVGRIDSLVHGPDYRQDKFYRLFFESSPHKIYYTANYYLAIEDHPSFSPLPGDTVCKISVVFRYKKKVGNIVDSECTTETLDSAYLRVMDFSENIFNKKTLSYKYPSYIKNSRGKDLELEQITNSDTLYIDDYPGTGIEFKVDWLGAKKLYVEGIEVYDDYIWNDYITSPTITIGRINTFASQYSNWGNIKYWYVNDEPQTLDSYEPYRVIDSILNNNNKPGVITTFYPQWEGRRNGDITLSKFKTLAKPQQLLMDYYPFWTEVSATSGLELLRGSLQEAYLQDTSFWYTAQSFGDTNSCDTNRGSWRTPTAEELKASVMLSLAHGAKGILYWKFICYRNSKLSCDTFFTSIVDTNFQKNALWYPIKEINQRLNNTLGNTLKGLSYTGEFDTIRYIETSRSRTVTFKNLLISPQNGYAANWHFSYLQDTTDGIYNEHYFAANLITDTTTAKQVQITAVKPTNSYVNYRFRNIEGGLDTTTNSSVSMTEIFPAGEGKLYQFAPVVKYGGKLAYTETVTGNDTLKGEMNILSGKTLTVSGIYTLKDSININYGGKLEIDTSGVLNIKEKRLSVNGELKVKGKINAYKDIVINSIGKLEVSPGAEINFFDGSKLKVTGKIIAKGNSTDSIYINFQNPNWITKNSIELKSGSIDTLTFCKISSGYYGIKAEKCEPFISDCEISHCEDGIYLSVSDYRPDMDEGTRIYNCSIHNNISNGINLYESSPLLMGNKLINNSVGIQCIDNSNAYLGKLYDYGFNDITGLDIGLISYGSDPLLGSDYLEFGGINGIKKSESKGSWDVYASKSYIMGEECWWGEYEVNEEDFYIIDESDLDYEPALESNPFNSNQPLIIRQPITITAEKNQLTGRGENPLNPGLSLKSQYKNAYRYYLTGQMVQAGNICKQIISSSPDSMISSGFTDIIQFNAK